MGVTESWGWLAVLAASQIEVNALAKILVVVLAVVSAHNIGAQGEVDFRNRILTGPPLGPDRLVRDVDGTPLLGTNFIAQLLYQDRSGTWIAHPVIARFFTSAANAGFWNGGSRTLVNAGSPASGVYVPVNMQVRAWDAGFGGTTGTPPITFEEAVAAGMRWGASEIFVYTEEWSLPRDTSDTYMRNFRGFSLVPEPSTWVLLSLGVGWLFWRYRRSK